MITMVNIVKKYKKIQKYVFLFVTMYAILTKMR